MKSQSQNNSAFRTTWSVEGCDAETQERLRSAWHKRSGHIESLLAPLGGRRQLLSLFAHRLAGPNTEYLVRAVLHLPTGVVVAEHGEEDPETALAAVADGLARAIRKHRQELHRDHVYRFKARHRAALNAADSFLARDVELGRREAFFELLRPMLGFLRQHAQWELHVLRQDGLVPRGQLDVDDLVDEVLVMAWEQFRRRPKGEPLDLWIIDLLHEVVRKWSKEPPHLSLEASTSPEPERSPEDEPGEWWLGDYERVPILEGMVPGASSAEAWEQLDAEERRLRVMAVLSVLPAERRQAFLLRTLEGFSATDVAQAQGRSEDDVKKDIAAARKFVRQNLIGSAATMGQPA